jgi:hypothetical protein
MLHQPAPGTVPIAPCKFLLALCVCAGVRGALPQKEDGTAVDHTKDGKSLTSRPRLSETKADTPRPADDGVRYRSLAQSRRIRGIRSDCRTRPHNS